MDFALARAAPITNFSGYRVYQELTRPERINPQAISQDRIWTWHVLLSSDR
jgi:hypothetical protein